MTNDITTLHGVTIIPDHYIGGIGSGIKCTNKGWYDIIAMDNTTISVPMFYSPNANDTVISPTNIVNTYQDQYDSVLQNFDVSGNKGSLVFYKKDENVNFDINPHRNQMHFNLKNGTKHTTISLIKKNNLYYVDDPIINAVYSTSIRSIPNDDAIYAVKNVAVYDLWHFRLGHPGQQTMENLHKHADGVPSLRLKNPFFKCKYCYQNMTKQMKGYSLHKNEATAPFQRVQMDFGFVKYKAKDGSGKLMRSRQGFGSYLLIVDEYTRYMWVFPTKSKEAPVQVVDQFLTMYKRNTGLRRVRADLGNEMARSKLIQNTVAKHGYVLERTAANSSFQNSKAERPHRTLGNMMRSMLKAADLDQSFWADSILHAVYLRNRLPHTTIGMSPYEKMTMKKPNLSHLRVFGTRVIVKDKEKRVGKLSDNCSIGIFLRFTGTDRNIVFYDTTTHQTRQARHVDFDETYFHESKAPPYAQKLKTIAETAIANKEIEDMLMKNDDKKIIHQSNTSQSHHTTTVEKDNDAINVSIEYKHFQIVSEDAHMPIKATRGAAGYDLYSSESKVIKGNGRTVISTGVNFHCPDGYFGQILSRSGLAVNHGIQVGAGVIDKDYEGELKVVLFNSEKDDYTVRKGDRIAQIVIQKIMDSSISHVLKESRRGDSGFGSTDSDKIFNVQSNQTKEVQYEDLILLDSPYDKVMKLKIRNRGIHPTRGLQIVQEQDRLLLKGCEKSTPAARIPCWRGTLRDAIVDTIDGIKVDSIPDIENLIQRNKEKYISIGFIPKLKLPSHPTENIPVIHFDQFLTIAHQHMAAKHDTDPWMNTMKPPDISPDLIYIAQQKGHANTKLTRKKLKEQDDWPLWKISEYQQLNQYKSQNMFQDPIPRPPDANVLPLIWIYVYKTNGVRKARLVCNGSPRMKGTVTLDHTYAAALEQTGSRLFWALTAIHNYIVSGGDASNAFAEASAPKAKLFVTIDEVFREWYSEIEQKPPIPKHYVLPVNHALQGHPESPRLWAKKIDSILTELGYKNTTHEPCLYIKTIDGKPIFFLRQVDDFLISTATEQTANEEFDLIQKGLREPMKRFGIVTAFNGTDIHQTKNFIKVSCKTYISKILKGHGWENLQHSATTSTPMRSDSKYIHDIETTKGPVNTEDQKILATEMKFSYRQAIGELLFAAITCRPDILYPVIKLSQYSNSPAKIHFIAVKNIFRYLRATVDEGLHYWRNGKQDNLPHIADPDLLSDNHVLQHPKESPAIPLVFVDSDWGGDTSHRKSITGSTLFMAGAPVMYKTKMQPTVALSSTEAEFVAASETGKMVLYLRSILDELGLHVKDATPMYIDNAGARQMANAQKPTRRTRHLDIRYFALTEWTEQDLIILKPISTSIRERYGICSKHLSK